LQIVIARFKCECNRGLLPKWRLLSEQKKLRERVRVVNSNSIAWKRLNARALIAI